MKKTKKSTVNFAAYVSPKIETTSIKPRTICQTSPVSGEHEGIEEDGEYVW